MCSKYLGIVFKDQKPWSDMDDDLPSRSNSPDLTERNTPSPTDYNFIFGSKRKDKKEEAVNNWL